MRRIMVAAGAVLAAAVVAGTCVSGAQARGFYTKPAGLSHYAMGSMIKTSPDTTIGSPAKEAGRWLRIMYRSESSTGAPRADTGIIVLPNGKPPQGGWPVIAWDHGTNGVGPACAPSRVANLGTQAYVNLIATLARAGYAVVAPDYEGSLPGEVSPYAEMDMEGRSTSDAIRAAHDRFADLRREWVVLGHSQGGQAAIATGEAATTRAPGYPLIGSVPMAPASHLAEAFDILQARVPPAVNTLPEMAFLLLSVQQSDPTFDPASVASPGMVAGLKLARTQCFNPVADFYEAHPPATLFSRPWRDSQAMTLFASRNDPGNVLSAGPMLLIQGEADPVVAPQLSAELAAKLCAQGQNVNFKTYPGVGHVPVVAASTSDIMAWVADRFAGRPATGNCTPAS